MSDYSPTTHRGSDVNGMNSENFNKDNDVFGYLGKLISELTTDVGNLVTLHLDLLKVELKDSSKTLARDSILVISGAVMGLFAFMALTAALVALIAGLLPIMDDAKAVAAGAGIVGALYAILAGLLVFMGINHLKKRSLAPEQTAAELRKDKEWVKEIK